MKLSDGFDARRLRPKGQRNWRFRFGAAFAALLATCGVLLAMAGAASLLGRPPALGELNASPLGSAIILAVGLLVLYIGVWLWRRCRRRSRQSRELNISPHLMKKHD
jgi:membrane protein implicated in regulation of membrane protease activity